MCMIKQKVKNIEEIIQSKKAAFDVARKNIRSSHARLTELKFTRYAFETDVNELKYDSEIKENMFTI